MIRENPFSIVKKPGQTTEGKTNSMENSSKKKTLKKLDISAKSSLTLLYLKVITYTSLLSRFFLHHKFTLIHHLKNIPRKVNHNHP